MKFLLLLTTILIFSNPLAAHADWAKDKADCPELDLSGDFEKSNTAFSKLAVITYEQVIKADQLKKKFDRESGFGDKGQMLLLSVGQAPIKLGSFSDDGTLTGENIYSALFSQKFGELVDSFHTLLVCDHNLKKIRLIRFDLMRTMGGKEVTSYSVGVRYSPSGEMQFSHSTGGL